MYFFISKLSVTNSSICVAETRPPYKKLKTHPRFGPLGTTNGNTIPTTPQNTENTIRGIIDAPIFVNYYKFQVRCVKSLAAKFLSNQAAICLVLCAVII